MGRQAIGEKAMTAAERMKLHRERMKAKGGNATTRSRASKADTIKSNGMPDEIAAPDLAPEVEVEVEAVEVEPISPSLAAEALAIEPGDHMPLLTKLGRGSWLDGIKRLDLVNLTKKACACARARGITIAEMEEIERRIAAVEAAGR